MACVWKSEDSSQEPTTWVLGSNSGYQAWQQVPVLTKPSHRRVFLMLVESRSWDKHRLFL